MPRILLPLRAVRQEDGGVTGRSLELLTGSVGSGEIRCRAGYFVVAAPWVVNDELWAVIEPLLPVKPAGTPGPAQHDPRLVFHGILFVLFTGIGWEDLPQELGFESGMRCWRRLRDWQAAGVFEAMHQAVLDSRQRRRVDRLRPGHDRPLACAGRKGAPRPDRARSTVPRPGPNTTC